ncbi:MAG: PspC domain-containing protein [Prolixibacteraceae bacterium]|jgi:phage shock protein C|nr:PspC domain-containing protein [Prolixibacteraceae bacterium]
MKRLRKSTNRVFSGVCAGISEYINPELDPVITRIGFSILTFFNPLMLILYIALAIILPGPEKNL